MIFRKLIDIVVLILVCMPLWYAQANAATCTHEDYCTTQNPFYQSGFGGQCTSYAWGRAYEKFGVNLSPRGHAGTWLSRTVKDNNTGNLLQTGSVVQSNSIAVWSKGEHGHVAYVEYVNNGKVYFTEANVGTYSEKNGNYGGGYDGYRKSKTISEFENRGGTIGKINGYIYLSSSSPSITLSSIRVFCPSSVSESSSSAGSCSAKAYYSNGTNRDVTNSVSWSDNSRALYIYSSGRFQTYSVSRDTNVTVKASYRSGGITEYGSDTIQIKNGNSSGNTGKALDGKDPNTTGCDRDGRTVGYKYTSYGKVELRWSSKCKTNWTRVKSYRSSYYAYASLWRSSDSKQLSKSGYGTIWTPMLYAPNDRACASGYINGKRSGWTCY